MQKDLFDLFEGDSTQYLTTSLTGEVDERGKHEVDCTTKHEPVTLELWEKHLKGEVRIGIRPERNDKIKWACIDVDPRSYKDYSQKKYVDLIVKNKIPLIPTRSKSGGLHLFLFLNEWSSIEKVRKKLYEWNNKYFFSKEIFPCNKALNMPYFAKDSTIEYAYDDNNTPVLLGRFIELAKQKRISIEDLDEIKTGSYEPEENWNNYPPCIQNLINEKWHGDNRNNFLFNMAVFEMKKSEGALTKKELRQKLVERNKQIFARPILDSEIDNTIMKSYGKKEYFYKCPPTHGELSPICNKELCKKRALGIGTQALDIVNDFDNIQFTQDLKGITYSFKYKGTYVIVKPEDMIDEKSWRKKLLNYRTFWKTLPRTKTGPNHFEILMEHIVTKASENENMKFEDTKTEEHYKILKSFFESHIEEDSFEKLKDGYVILDSETSYCYFKKSTLQEFLDKGKKIFNTAQEAVNFLNCERLEYHEGEKNLWRVKMPDFVNYSNKKIKDPKTKEKEISELDDEFHTDKFKI
jgi:hypothetical protein